MSGATPSLLRADTLLLTTSMLFAVSGSSLEPIQTVDASDTLSLVSQQRGKVVLLNFWATWCPPCIEEFPDIVAVEKDYRDRGLVVISVSADFPEKKESELRPFLEKHKPRFPVYIMRTTDPNSFVRKIDPEWTGTLPSTFFFDREGKSSIKRYSKMSREEIERILEALLDEPKD